MKNEKLKMHTVVLDSSMLVQLQTLFSTFECRNGFQ